MLATSESASMAPFLMRAPGIQRSSEFRPLTGCVIIYAVTNRKSRRGPTKSNAVDEKPVPLGDLLQIGVTLALALVGSASSWLAVKATIAVVVTVLAVVAGWRAWRQPASYYWHVVAAVLGVIALALVMAQPILNLTDGKAAGSTSAVQPGAELAVGSVTFDKQQDGSWTATIQGESHVTPGGHIYVIARPGVSSPTEFPGPEVNDTGLEDCISSLSSCPPRLGGDGLGGLNPSATGEWYTAKASEPTSGTFVGTLQLPAEAINKGPLTFLAAYIRGCSAVTLCSPTGDPDYEMLRKYGPLGVSERSEVVIAEP